MHGYTALYIYIMLAITSVTALENYKKSGGHDTSLEKFENKNFTIQVRVHEYCHYYS